MTYVRKPKVFKVAFEEPHSLAGLSLQTHGLSVKEFAAFGLKLGAVAEIEQAGTNAEKLSQLSGLLGAVEEVRSMFAEKLISWDMQEEDGSPTPATPDGVNLLSDDEFFTLVAEWLSAIGGVDESMGKDSTHGETFQELSNLMEPLSQNQAS